MELKFTKMHGCGNDYIFLNGFNHLVKTIIHKSTLAELSRSLSHRHFGIGGDGIVLILPSSVADAKMRMFNADGSEGNMCGNAIRCVAKYLFDHNLIFKRNMKIETLSGIKEVLVSTLQERVTSVKVNMGQAILTPTDIPVALDILPRIDKTIRQIVNMPLHINNMMYSITCVSMGNPHAVIFCNDVDALDLREIGPLFEHHPLFPERINTEFVQVCSENNLKMRVWERGSGETFSCGTGACASVVAAVLNRYCQKNQEIKVDLLGGSLNICYTDQTVWMTGSCNVVFEGVIPINFP